LARWALFGRGQWPPGQIVTRLITFCDICGRSQFYLESPVRTCHVQDVKLVGLAQCVTRVAIHGQCWFPAPHRGTSALRLTRTMEHKMTEYTLPESYTVRIAAIQQDATIKTGAWNDDSVSAFVLKGIHNALNDKFAGFSKSWSDLTKTAQNKVLTSFLKTCATYEAGNYRYSPGSRGDELSTEIRAMATAKWRAAKKTMKELEGLRDMSGDDAVLEYIAVLHAVKHNVRPDLAIRHGNVIDLAAGAFREKVEAAARQAIANRSTGPELATE